MPDWTDDPRVATYGQPGARNYSYANDPRTSLGRSSSMPRSWIDDLLYSMFAPRPLDPNDPSPQPPASYSPPVQQPPRQNQPPQQSPVTPPRQQQAPQPASQLPAYDPNHAMDGTPTPLNDYYRQLYARDPSHYGAVLNGSTGIPYRELYYVDRPGSAEGETREAGDPADINIQRQQDADFYRQYPTLFNLLNNRQNNQSSAGPLSPRESEDARQSLQDWIANNTASWNFDVNPNGPYYGGPYGYGGQLGANAFRRNPSGGGSSRSGGFSSGYGGGGFGGPGEQAPQAIGSPRWNRLSPTGQASPLGIENGWSPQNSTLQPWQVGNTFGYQPSLPQGYSETLSEFASPPTEVQGYSSSISEYSPVYGGMLAQGQPYGSMLGEYSATDAPTKPFKGTSYYGQQKTTIQVGV